MPSGTYRVRLVFEQKDPPYKCWYEVDSNIDRTISDLITHIARDFGITSASLSLSVEGFELLPVGTTAGLVRDGDLITVTERQSPSTASSVRSSKRKHSISFEKDSGPSKSPHKTPSSSDKKRLCTETSKSAPSSDSNSDLEWMPGHDVPPHAATSSFPVLKKGMNNALQQLPPQFRASSKFIPSRSFKSSEDAHDIFDEKVISMLDQALARARSIRSGQNEDGADEEEGEVKEGGSTAKAITAPETSSSEEEDDEEEEGKEEEEEAEEEETTEESDTSSEPDTSSSSESESSSSESDTSSEASTSGEEADEEPTSSDNAKLPVGKHNKANGVVTPQTTSSKPVNGKTAAPHPLPAKPTTASSVTMDVPISLGKHKRKQTMALLSTPRQHFHFDDEQGGGDGVSGDIDVEGEPPEEVPNISHVPQTTPAKKGKKGKGKQVVSTETTDAGGNEADGEGVSGEARVVFTKVYLYDEGYVATPRKEGGEGVEGVTGSGKKRRRRRERKGGVGAGGVNGVEGLENGEEMEVGMEVDAGTKDVSAGRKDGPQKDYESLPELVGMPVVGQVIAFKILELNPVTYAPEISDFKEAQVISLTPHKSSNGYRVTLKYLSAKQAPAPEKMYNEDGEFVGGKFDLPPDEEWVVEGGGDVVEVGVEELVGVRVLG
ncbi:hypothetical protein HDV00_002286 [Rhizophlyctis rosea]|nr:hypothetical protein HDV00_002286 [Rhizophlyctis rosea]